MRALAIGNGYDFDTGFVGHRFREHGYVFTECDREHPEEWPALDGFDLVLTLGSEWHVYEPATAGPVEAEAALLREVLARDVPLFAICFGAQVLSRALGGTVGRLPAPVIGWVDVAVDGAGGIPAGPWMEWHLDVFTLPEGFVELARTDAGPELVRGRRSVATQFHPEVTETMVARWLRMGGADQLRREGGDPTDLLAVTRVNVELSAPQSAALVDWFLASTTA